MNDSKSLNDRQKVFIHNIGLLMLSISARERRLHAETLSSLLEFVGLSLDDHPYLMGERFRQELPGAVKTLRGHRPTIGYSLFGIDDDPMYDTPYFTGATSLEEMAEFVARTKTMVRNYLRDPRYHARGTASTTWRELNSSVATGKVQLWPLNENNPEMRRMAEEARMAPRDAVKKFSPKSRGY